MPCRRLMPLFLLMVILFLFPVGLETYRRNTTVEPPPLSPAWLQFKTYLEDASSRNASPVDLQHHNLHFVVLFNKADDHAAGPVLALARNLYYDLINKYLRSGDKLSFVPYQLKIQEADAFWGRDFDLKDTGKFFASARQTPQSALEQALGGHNDEKAVAQAIDQVGNMGLAESTVYILLSTKDVSEKPLPVPADATAPEVQEIIRDQRHDYIQDIKGANVSTREYKQIVGNINGGTNSTVWTRIFVPSQLHALGTLQGTRDIPPVIYSIWQIVITGVCWAIAIGLLGYYIRLRFSRKIAVAGKEQFVNFCTEVNVYVNSLDEIELSTGAQTRIIAKVFVDWGGKVLIRANTSYTFSVPRNGNAILRPDQCVELTKIMKDIIVSDQSNKPNRDADRRMSVGRSNY